MNSNNILVNSLKWTTGYLWPAMLLLLMLITVFVPKAAAQGDDSPTLTVITPVLSVRTGPGMTNEVIDYLWQDEQVSVTGYDAPSGWWQVELSDGKSGWVSGRPYDVSVTGDTAKFVESTATSTEPAGNKAQLTGGNSQSGTIVFQTASGGPIYAINPDGTNLRYLTTGMDPAISPDGQWVAFTRWESDGHGSKGSLWVINVDGTGERVVLNDVRQPKSPTWSSDGSQIALNYVTGGRFAPKHQCSDRPPNEPLMADEDGDYFEIRRDVDEDGKMKMEICYILLPRPYWGLQMVNATTGEFQDLASDKFSYAPTWNPVNEWQLVYNGEQGLVSLDMNQDTRWLVTEDFNDYAPVFSPDGSKIAVSYWQNDHWEVHVMNADGSGRQRLTETSIITLVEQQLQGEQPHSFNNAAPAWSPDGTQIAFLTDRTGQWEILVMNADGSNQHPLLDSAAQAQLGLQYHGVNERMLSWGP
ncbi:MAG: PD40 domain-containing protein [Anaerolineae bacterium]|nr:PD40 domain-containing protein [Anaerolineae bacterium]